MYSCADLKKGIKLMIDNEPHVIVQFDFTKPGKGQALYKCKLRNMITGSLFDRTYRSGESFEPASLDELVRRMEAHEFDLVAVGRALIANPEWANLVRDNHSDQLQAFSADLLGELV